MSRAALNLLISLSGEPVLARSLRTQLTQVMLMQRAASSRTTSSRQCKPHVRPRTSHVTPRSAANSSMVALKVNVTVNSVRAVVREPLGGAIYPSGNENGGCVAKKADAPDHVAAVVMITFNRPTYLRKAVESLLSVHHRDPGYRCASAEP